MDEVKDEVKVEVPAKFAKIVEEIEKMSVLDLNELVKVFEAKFGVSAAAAVVGCLEIAGQLKKNQAAVIVTVLCDSGDKYLSERFWHEG